MIATFASAKSYIISVTSATAATSSTPTATSTGPKCKRPFVKKCRHCGDIWKNFTGYRKQKFKNHEANCRGSQASASLGQLEACNSGLYRPLFHTARDGEEPMDVDIDTDGSQVC